MGNQWIGVFLNKLHELVKAADGLQLEIDFTDIEEGSTYNRAVATFVFHHEVEKEA